MLVSKQPEDRRLSTLVTKGHERIDLVLNPEPPCYETTALPLNLCKIYLYFMYKKKRFCLRHASEEV